MYFPLHFFFFFASPASHIQILYLPEPRKTWSFAFHSQNEATWDFMEEDEILLVSQQRGGAVNFYAAGVCKYFLNMTGADTVGLGVWALVAVRENSDLPQT